MTQPLQAPEGHRCACPESTADLVRLSLKGVLRCPIHLPEDTAPDTQPTPPALNSPGLTDALMAALNITTTTH